MVMNQLLTRLAAAIFVMSFVSCEKSESKVFRDNKADIKNCRVTQIIYSPCCGIKNTMVFAYNTWGDPITITQTPLVGTGTPNYFFKYDKKRRLTELLGLYSGGDGGEVWHKYFYENPGNSNIVLDSNYLFPSFQNGIMIWYHTASATFFTYDKLGRITKDSTISTLYQAGQYTIVNNYVYDANGNLSGPVYDDQVNINQTHPIWMFLNRDYSLNNPFVADAYNSARLPARINLPAKSGSVEFLHSSFKQGTISYECQ